MKKYKTTVGQKVYAYIMIALFVLLIVNAYIEMDFKDFIYCVFCADVAVMVTLITLAALGDIAFYKDAPLEDDSKEKTS